MSGERPPGVQVPQVPVLLAVETKSLIIGEAAVPEQIAAIEQALRSAPGVYRVIHRAPCT